jgi:hypothetical protein
VLGDFWIDEFAAMGTKARECAGFVLTHEAAVTGDIGGENGRKTTLYPLPAQLCSPRSSTRQSAPPASTVQRQIGR